MGETHDGTIQKEHDVDFVRLHSIEEVHGPPDAMEADLKDGRVDFRYELEGFTAHVYDAG